MRCEVAVKLRTVTLLDDENSLLTLKSGGKLFGSSGGQQSRRDEADLDTVLRRAGDGFADGAGNGAPRDHGEIAGSLDSRPMVAVVEMLQLVATLIKLDLMVRGAAGRDTALRVGQAVCRVLSAAQSRNRHRRNAVGYERIAFVFPSNLGCLEHKRYEIGRA